MNEVLWNSEMTLCVGLICEMDEELFEKKSLNEHLELTGEHLSKNEYRVSKNEIIFMLKVV